MSDFDKFLLWEAKSKDTIDFKKVYVDIAGDLIAGLLLSQIIYWHLPNGDGDTRLKVKKEGVLWLAKGRGDWWDEIRISPKQFDRASDILIEKGILIKKYFRFDGLRTIHIRLNHDRFMYLWQEEMNRPVSTKGETRSRPKGKPGLDQRGRPLTETTTENTTDIGATPAPSPEPQPPQPVINHEADWLLHNHNGHDQTEIDAISQVETFWRSRIGQDAKQAIALYVKAMTGKGLDATIPRDKSTQGKWGAGIRDHLDNYSLDELKTLYPLAIQHATERGWDLYSPQSLTTALGKVKAQAQNDTRPADSFFDLQYETFKEEF